MDLIYDSMKTLGLAREAVKANIPSKTVTVRHLAQVTGETMCSALNDKMLGARVLTAGGHSKDGKRQPYSLQRLLADFTDANSMLSRLMLALQAVLFFSGIIVQHAGLGDGNLPGTLFVIVVLLGHTLVQRALMSLLLRRITIHLLMGMVLVGALVLHKFREAATVALVVSGSEWLVGCVNAAVEAALQRSLAAGATHATVLKPDGSMEQTGIDKLTLGDVVLVRSGEVIPVDGKVLKSNGFKVDEASVTGEAMPLEKVVGNSVLSGTVVTGGTGEIECTALAKDSFQGRMQQAVEDARSTRSATEELVNRLAAVYTPLVVLGAILVAVFTGEPERGLTALIGACPCALVAAAPMVQACVFVRLLSDLQVLVKNARALETLGRLSALGVDKTGTLTEGQFDVVDVAVMPGAEGRQQDELFRLLCAVEARDPHPLASSIVRAHIGCAAEFASGNGAAALPRVDKFTRVESKGVWGMVNNVVVGAGSLDFLEDMCIDVPAEAVATRDAWEESGGAFTTVYMSIDEDVAMVLRLEDAVRSDAKAAVQLLGTEGVGVSMLTGDSELPARAVCAQVGITDFNAKMRPLGKEAWVRDQQFKPEDGGKLSQVAQASEGALEAGLLEKKPARRIAGAVGMLGDGLNDGPAMAAADVGIAISCGLQLTVDAADVVVNKGGQLLLRLAGAVAMAKRGRRLVIQNLVLAMAIKVVVMMLAASGQLSLSMGIFTDTGSLLLVLLNGLRPLTWRVPFERDSTAA